MPYIDLRIEFKSEEEDQDWSFYEPESITVISTDLHANLDQISEYLAQSDFGQIDFLNAILDAIAADGLAITI